MKDTSFSHRADGGIALHVHGFAPESAPRAVLHVVHGMAEHGGRYARLAESFTQHGFVVYAHDHRGHGRSVASPAELGHIAERDGFMCMVEDAHAVNRAIAERHPGLPIVLLGHSMGSFVAHASMIRHPEDFVGVALSGSNGEPPLIARLGRIVARAERLRVGGRGVSGVLRALSFGGFNKKFAPNRTAFDWLSRDEHEVDKYVADPLCGFDCDVQLWIDLLDALDRIVFAKENRARIPKSLPVYLLSGDRDPVGDMGAGVRRLQGLFASEGMRDLTCTLYPGARHENLNETHRDQVTSDLLAFAERVVAASSAKAA